MEQDYKRQSFEHRSDLAGEHRLGDSLQLVFLVVFAVGMIVDVFFLRFFSNWQDVVPWYVRLLAFFVIFYGAYFFIKHAHDIIFGEQRLKISVVNSGVYARVRHPMYFGTILAFFAFVVLSFSVVAMIIFVLIVCLFWYLSFFEERLLIDAVGDEYRRYMKDVPMLFPRFW